MLLLRRIPLLVLTLAAMSLSVPIVRAGSAPSSVFQHFITRDGGKLMEGEREFRFIGVNMPGVTSPYDFSLQIPERMILPNAWELEDGFKTLVQMNTPVVRWNSTPVRWPGDARLPRNQPVLAPGKFNEETFRVYDQALALANKHGVRVIFALTGGIGIYSMHRNKDKGLFFTDRELTEDYKATVRFILNRVNTVTGVPYREDKAILAWQIGNELGHGTTVSRETLAAWEAEISAYIKSLDRNHLVMSSVALKPIPAELDPNMDIYTRHYYGADTEPWVNRLKTDLAALQGRRPFIIGEWGPYIESEEQAPLVMKMHYDLIDEVVKSETSGALLWSMFFRHRDGGFWWHQIMTFKGVWSYHWPGFPNGEPHREREILQSVRNAGFRIQGRTPTPLPAPEAPELLPFDHVPMFSWRGSVGAESYIVERAPAADGPWTTLTRDASDADVAYRPLFSDETARTDETYFYRVSARNRSGESSPSNVIGPVRVESVRFVDELKDFSRVARKSAGITLDNDYNSIFAEYLYRAKGDAGDSLVYEVPHALNSFFVCAWTPLSPQDLSFETSADGATFTAVPTTKLTQSYPSPYMGRTKGWSFLRNDYSSVTIPTGHRFLRIVWHGPTRIDRVELGFENP